MTIIDPVTKKPLQDSEGNIAQVKVAGTHGARWERAVRDWSDGKFIGVLARTNGEQSPSRAYAERRAFICARLTLDWRNFARNGEPLAPTTENAEELYLKVEWLADQVDSFAPQVHSQKQGAKAGEMAGSPEGHLLDTEKKQLPGADGLAESQAA